MLGSVVVVYEKGVTDVTKVWQAWTKLKSANVDSNCPVARPEDIDQKLLRQYIDCCFALILLLYSKP